MKAESFTTIRSVGGLLPPDTLARAAEGRDLPGLAQAAYHLIEGETVRTAANRAWTRLMTAWASFRTALEASPEADAATGLTRDKWLQILFTELGYGRVATTPAGGIVADGTAYPVSHIWGAVPIHLVGARIPLDRRTRGVAGAATRAPHSMLQELLNRSEEHLWGIVSNGHQLRLLRDNASLVRDAYVEFDLEAMFDGEIFSDFVVLYLVCHQSRFEADPITECWLERWRSEAVASGTRALDALREGVTEALRTLGTGFLRHPDNAKLRQALADATLDKQDYYRALLRLVYRLLFAFVAEDRDLLLQQGNDASVLQARRRYSDFFSTARLRGLATRRRGTRHGDLWHTLRLAFDALGSDDGCAELALPALGGLFDPDTLGMLEHGSLSNEALLGAIRSLSQVTQNGITRAIDFRNLGAEELGSVYESLLELAPQHDPATGDFGLKVLSGNERKTTGSYYTPTSLIDCLLDTALDPLLDQAMSSDDREAALLALTVCDPACGSGHFLVAAARRIARRLAAVRTGEAEPTPEATRSALRDVVGRCIYGVDVNDLAAELAKVSLWLEALEPGKPLSFLDGHIRVGNSLLGVTPALLAPGVPDDAFEPIAGDDGKLAASWKRRNRDQRRGQGELFGAEPIRVSNAGLSQQAAAIAEQDDSTPKGVRRRADAWRRLEESPELARAKLLADAWCAAFVWPLSAGATAPPTQGVVMSVWDDPTALPKDVLDEINRLGRTYRFFHWHLEFPEVFLVSENLGAAENPDQGWSGGFSCVLGNPPWERVKLQEQEFFAARHPEIATAPNATKRRRMIAELAQEDPTLLEEFRAAKRRAEGESHLMCASGRYPLNGRGDINTYSVFAEGNRSLLNPRGRLGMIVPTGIATDATTQRFFRAIIESQTLASLYDFENSKPLFEGVHRSFKFSLLTLTGASSRVPAADFGFFLRDPADLSKPDARFPLTPEEILLLNPNTGTCPVFRSRRDAEITLGIYSRLPILLKQNDPKGNVWSSSFMTMFHMANDSGLFQTRAQLEAEGWVLAGNIFTRNGDHYLPLFEAKMLDAFDHRAADVVLSARAAIRQAQPSPISIEEHADASRVAIPRYWVAEKEVRGTLRDRWTRPWLMGWRDVTSPTNARTTIASVTPLGGVGHKLPLILSSESTQALACLYANLNSFAFDYVARQKVAGISYTYFYIMQLPVPRPSAYSTVCAWQEDESLAAWIGSRVLELTYTAWDMKAFAEELGDEGPPFKWDEERRVQLRAELDAAFFHIYGVDRNDVDYILETFPIVKRKDMARFGEYSTKRLILEIYDAMAKAMAGGPQFHTVDPPPARGPRHAEG